jgi:regulator of protease activity HflC (stomatin/prohibitin superfamily)
MSLVILVLGVSLAVAIVAGGFKLQGALRGLAALAALVVLILSFLGASIVVVGSDEVGVVSKNIGFKKLTDGRIIATGGEMGVQADVLSPGLHFGYWPIIYSVDTEPLTQVKSGEIALIETSDGLPLTPGQVFAPEWPLSESGEQPMLVASHFLTVGKGKKGPQVSVLTPGKYRLNPRLYKIRSVPVTEIAQGEVGVLKANFGAPPSRVVEGIAGLMEGASTSNTVPAVAPTDDVRLRLASEGEMGVREQVLPPGKYPINPEAYTVVEMWTTQIVAQFTKAAAVNPASRTASGGDASPHPAVSEEREIRVRTSDGFTFPVDVRVEYFVEPRNAPIVVAKLGDDEGERFRNALNSAVRAIFRNNAEGVRALDYVQQRSHQESQSLKMLAEQMERFGVTITAVRIGDVGDEQTLGTLLKTQTDRELAKQEQLTFQEQQKAAEQKKQLSKVTQEAEEEKRLATAAYAVKIADEEKKKAITMAQAEAESIRIRGEAQAAAYQSIAEQIGKSNAALVEVLKIVGEMGIQIAPRVMVVNGRDAGGGGAGGAGSSQSGETTALIGTMLDTMLAREPDSATPSTNPVPAKRERTTGTSGPSVDPQASGGGGGGSR